MGMLQRVRNRWKRDAVSAEIDEELAVHLAEAHARRTPRFCGGHPGDAERKRQYHGHCKPR